MKIGVLTGGGDCPGLNAVIRAIVRKGTFHYEDEFLGFVEGWRGLLEDKIISFTRELMHFDHFAIRLLDRKTNKLELVISAGLLLRSLSSLLHLNAGFDPNNVMSASLSLNDVRYRSGADCTRLFRDSLERVRQIPGVESAAVGLSLPYQMALNVNVNRISGHPVEQETKLVNLVYATPGFFGTLRIPLLRGRAFDVNDNANTPKVAVVDEAFIRSYLPHRHDPIGEQIEIRLGASESYSIVGVVQDVLQQHAWGNEYAPLAALPEMWVPAAQLPDGDFQLIHQFVSPNWVVRTRGPVANLEREMRESVLAVDLRLPFSSFHELTAARQDALSQPRYQAALFSVFAGLALVLCALGIYGLIAQSVAERTREMGIRIALGATTKDIVRAAVLPGVGLACAGVGCGVLVSFFATRLLKSLIWGVTVTDPATFVIVSALVVLVAAAASLFPALRLVRLDPAETLRTE